MQLIKKLHLKTREENLILAHPHALEIPLNRNVSFISEEPKHRGVAPDREYVRTSAFQLTEKNGYNHFFAVILTFLRGKPRMFLFAQVTGMNDYGKCETSF